MAGAGFKTFTAGAVLTATEVNTYLMQQATQVYASSAARASAVPVPTEGMVTYLSDTNIVETYDGVNFNPIDSVINVRTAATASFNLGAGDAGDLLQVNATGSGTVTVTVLPDATYTFPIGCQINLLSVGTATVATAAGTGVTLNGTPGLVLRAQYSSATLLKRAADTWVVIGDLKA
jgi:hypothetical protein